MQPKIILKAIISDTKMYNEYVQNCHHIHLGVALVMFGKPVRSPMFLHVRHDFFFTYCPTHATTVLVLQLLVLLLVLELLVLY